MTIEANDQTFRAEVLGSPIPVLVHFWAPWCGLCQMIDPILTRLKLEFGEDFKVVRINADENLKLANTYRLKSLPTILLFQNGEIVQRLERFHSGDDLRRALGDVQLVLQQSRSLTV